MKHYRISADETANNSPDIRTSIREILRDIGKDDEYNLNGDRLLLQLYTSRDGGGELFISRLYAKTEEETDESGSIHLPKEEEEEETDGYDEEEEEYRFEQKLSDTYYRLSEASDMTAVTPRQKTSDGAVYRFESLHILSASLRLFRKRAKSARCRIFADDKNFFYLVIDGISPLWCRPVCDSVVGSCADAIDGRYFKIYIEEHGKCIADEESIDEFLALFGKPKNKN